MLPQVTRRQRSCASWGKGPLWASGSSAVPWGCSLQGGPRPPVCSAGSLPLSCLPRTFLQSHSAVLLQGSVIFLIPLPTSWGLSHTHQSSCTRTARQTPFTRAAGKCHSPLGALPAGPGVDPAPATVPSGCPHCHPLDTSGCGGRITAGQLLGWPASLACTPPWTGATALCASSSQHGHQHGSEARWARALQFRLPQVPNGTDSKAGH